MICSKSPLPEWSFLPEPSKVCHPSRVLATRRRVFVMISAWTKTHEWDTPVRYCFGSAMTLAHYITLYYYIIILYYILPLMVPGWRLRVRGRKRCWGCLVKSGLGNRGNRASRVCGTGRNNFVALFKVQNLRFNIKSHDRASNRFVLRPPRLTHPCP